MNPRVDNSPRRDTDIVVITEDQDPVTQPLTFQLCPLGLQCYCKQKMETYQIIDFRMQLPGENGHSEEINCPGIVVDCKPDKQQELYRVWIKFVDLPESIQQRMRNVASTSKLLCPFCENF